MNCKGCRLQLQQWLLKRMEGRTEPLQSDVLDHTDSCPDCRRRLTAAYMVLEAQSDEPGSPPGLEQRIKAKLREHVRTRTGDERTDIRRFQSARGVGLRLTAAAALLVIGLFTGVVLGRMLPNNGTQDPTAVAPTAEQVVRVEFRLEAPDAHAVSVVGDWNGWDSTADPLADRDADGIWEASITLRPGEEYQYQFLIDDQEWVPDPASPLHVDDGFGGTNSVLNI